MLSSTYIRKRTQTEHMRVHKGHMHIGKLVAGVINNSGAMGTDKVFQCWAGVAAGVSSAQP